jgi:hypothetical protein
MEKRRVCWENEAGPSEERRVWGDAGVVSISVTAPPPSLRHHPGDGEAREGTESEITSVHARTHFKSFGEIEGPRQDSAYPMSSFPKR